MATAAQAFRMTLYAAYATSGLGDEIVIEQLYS